MVTEDDINVRVDPAYVHRTIKARGGTYTGP